MTAIAVGEAGPLGLDLVSPLPPVRSGIADYCADLLPALATRCDLRLVELPDLPVDERLRASMPVVPAARLGEDGRLPLYQMGNNRYHEAVHTLAMQVPGVVTLHDLVLHHFLIDRTVNRGDVEAYREALSAEHGWLGDAAARTARWPGGHSDAAKFALPAHRRLLSRQRGVLTHSAWAASMVREELPGLAVETIPMGVPLPERASPGEACAERVRSRHGVPAGAPLLGTFGFQTPMKRTDSVIRALADPRLASVHLLVAGEVAPACDFEGLASQLGVADRVHLLGFLPFDHLQEAIASVDVCINLRYPTAGETSASLLRILAVGRAALVSDHAQSADLPDDGVIKIPVGDGEREALVERLATLLADPVQLDAIGRAARRYVAVHHRPEDAADALVTACRRLGRRPAGDGTLPDVPAPTSLIWRALDGTLTVEGGDAPWPVGERRQLTVTLTNRSEAHWLAGERFPGGIALEVRLEAGGQDVLAGTAWPGLPFDLPPGQAHAFSVAVRKPLSSARLHIEPHVLGHRGFASLGGPVWEAEI